MTEVEVAWLAGLLEGEGYFGWKNGGPEIRLAMSDLDTVNKAALLMGGKPASLMRRKRPAHHKNLFQKVVTGYKAARILPLIRPFMSARRGAVIDDLLSWRPKKRERGTANSKSSEYRKAAYWADVERSRERMRERWAANRDRMNADQRRRRHAARAAEAGVAAI